MKVKIGIFGSAKYELEEIKKKAQKLGEVLADFDVILITGACSGLPYEVAKAAYKKKQTEIWGYSPAVNYQGQLMHTPNDDNSIYSKLIYTPATFELVNDLKASLKYRNVISSAACDGAIIISGRWGTLNEFTNLFDMGKVIGVLTQTGGVADLLSDLNKKIHKKSKAVVFFNDSAGLLVQKVIKEIKRRKEK